MTSDNQGEILSKLDQILDQFDGQAPARPLSGWSNRPRPQPRQIEAVAVPVCMRTSAGRLRVYLSLPGQCAADEETLAETLEELLRAGMPLDVWDRGSGSSSGWGGQQRSYGGYRR